ncbi:MAG: methyltransferase [Bacteroidales bacterium]|nr:methyltransferase [Bacteroidales bacterium]
MAYTFQNKEYHISRYPKTEMKSLQAWNASDELMLEYLEDQKILPASMSIYHDRFGFLSTLLAEYQPKSVILFQSQRKAINQNLKQNGINEDLLDFTFPLEKVEEACDITLIKVPKSADLFELYLQHLSTQLHDKSVVIAGFMTKYFSRQVLEIAQKYFDEVSQSQAKKKARLLILKKPKKAVKRNIIKEIKLNDEVSFQQYFGVFSAKNIDYATQFLMEHLTVLPTDLKVLDLGTGNGVLAWKARQLNANTELNLHDDNYLAIESAKLNLPEDGNIFHFSDDLSTITSNSYDLVISNPPFHFEYETNIEVSLKLFKQVWEILKPQGSFQLVSNRHLNYQTHLSKIFKHIDVVAENDKYIVYSCQKS